MGMWVSADAPARVGRAIALLWASMALSLFLTVIFWEPFEEADCGPCAEIAVAITAVFFAGWVVLVHLAGRRRAWARNILLAISLLVAACYAVFPEWMFDDMAYEDLLLLVPSIVDLVALYLLYTGESRAWFSHRPSLQ